MNMTGISLGRLLGNKEDCKEIKTTVRKKRQLLGNEDNCMEIKTTAIE